MWILAGILIPASFILGLVFWLTSNRYSGDMEARDTSRAHSKSSDTFRLELPPTEVARLLPDSPQANSGATPRFVNWSSSAGIEFRFYPDVQPGRFFLPEIMGGGVGWLDFDGDGLLDLFFTNGCRLPRAPQDREHLQKLYRQVDGGQFVEIGPSANADLNIYSQGCAVGDTDNDGFSDIALASYGGVFLLQNNGDGTFTQQANAIGLNDDGWSTTSALGDVDRDGDLDLYVAHYAITSIETTPTCYYENGKVRGYCGPANYECEPDVLFLNQGDGGFERATSDTGCLVEPEKPGKGLGVVIADLNNDGWPDIYVANDMDANFLFHNLGQTDSGMPRFNEVGMRAGAAASVDGVPEASMGVACADFTGELRLDLFLTHYYMAKNTFYQNHGNLTFSDRSAATGLAAPSLPFLGFGTLSIDYDLDGWQDIFVANGHVLGKDIKPFTMRPQLFRNLGQARFVEVTNRAGPYFFDQWVGRGAALGDFDNDGDEDFVVVHHDNRPVALLRNDTERTGKPLALELIGKQTTRSAIGTRILVRTDERTILREIIGGGSYLSASDLRVRVGLVRSQQPPIVTVYWPSGLVEQWSALEPGRYWRLVEGSGSRVDTVQAAN
jgi:hypothetical protein